MDLTVISFGGGQDSTTIWHKFRCDPAWRAKYCPGRTIFVMAETSNEHRQTNAHREEVQRIAAAEGIEFFHITPDLGFHSAVWQGLNEHHDEAGTIGSVAFPKTCTDNLKIRPIYRFLDAWIGREYGLDAGKKKAIKAFAKKFGKIRVLIGIAKGEESRVADPSKLPVWMRNSIQTVYPLIEEGLGRAECQAYIRSVGASVPLPSNCIRCPFLSPIELLWMFRFETAEFLAWAAQERRKLDANRDQGARNLGVFGRKTLFQSLDDAIRKHGQMSDADLWEYKMSHGHCVASKY